MSAVVGETADAALQVPARDPMVRRRAASIWALRSGLELSVSAAYCVITRELFETGADQAVLELCSAAGSEEVGHAVLCLKVAEELDGAPRPWPVPTSLDIPSYPGVAYGPLLVALHIVAMSCLNESIACVRLAEAMKLTRSTAVMATLQRILRDEVRHARAGWAHLASQRVSASMKTEIGVWVPDLIAASLRGLIDENSSIPNEDLAALGLPSVEQARAHAEKAVHELILPGFAHLRVPVDEHQVRERLSS